MTQGEVVIIVGSEVGVDGPCVDDGSWVGLG